MKRKTTYIIIQAALVLAGCQSEEIEIIQNSGDRTVKYAVASSQQEWTKAAGETNASSLMLSDKEYSITIPLEYVVTEGIGVSPEKSVQTKGTLVNTTGDDYRLLSEFSDIVGSFAAKAYDDAGTEKLFQTVTWSGSVWEASPTAYWPQDTKLNFLTYANLPSGQTASIASTGVSTSHTVPAAAYAQTDILFGHYSGNGGSTGTAEIRFEHPMTAVRFIRGEVDDGAIIKSISLAGVAKSGTTTMNPDGEISWSDVSTCDYSVSQEGDATTGLPVDVTSGLIGEPFIMIPQKLAGHNVDVTVTFTDGTTVAATLTSGEWKAGYTNTYTLKYCP